jgi:hypothetical protein
VKWGELNCYLLLDDGDEVTVGRDAAQMQSTMTLIKEISDSCLAFTIIVRDIGFGKDDPAGSVLKPMGRLSMKQYVTALTGSGMISVNCNAKSVSTHTGTNADSSPPTELYVMEARLNAKDFHCLDRVKCAGHAHTIQDRPMGTLWDKRIVGTTVHASRTLLAWHIHKVLTHPLMFPKDDFSDQCCDIVSTSEGCGYAYLHNIIRLAHPILCDKVVETVIPYQGNTVSFAAHVRYMTQYLAREKLHSRLYTKYKAPMTTLETLQTRFRTQMKHNDGLLFEVGHNKVDYIPFNLAMSNLATTLTSWVKYP